MALGDKVENIYLNDNTLKDIVLNSDRSRVFFADNNGYIKQFDFKTESIINSFRPGTDDGIIDLSPDNSILVYSDGYWGTKEVKTIDAETGDTIVNFTSHYQEATTVSYHPSREQVFTGGWERGYFWEPTTGNILATFDPNDDILSSVFFADGTKILLGGYGKWWIVEVATGNVLAQKTDLFGNEDVRAVDVNSTGDKFLTSHDNSGIKIWDMTTYDIIGGDDINEVIHTAEFNFDDSLIYFGTSNCPVTAIDALNYNVIYTSSSANIGYALGLMPDKDIILATNGSYISSFQDVLLVDNIIFTDQQGRARNTNTGITLTPLDFGVVRYAENSDIMELYFENRTDVQIGDIVIKAKDGTLNTGVVAEFSKTLDPFDALSQLNFAGPYNPGEKQVFYMRIDSDNTADPNTGSFELEVTGLNV